MRPTAPGTWSPSGRGGKERPMEPRSIPPLFNGLVVHRPVRRRHCADCRRGPLPLLVRENGAPRCLDCADLGHLVLLPRGDTALTRRAREESTLSAVVVDAPAQGPLRAAGRPGGGGGAGPGRAALSRGRRGTPAAPGTGRTAAGGRGRAVHGGLRGGDTAAVPRLSRRAGPVRRRAHLGPGQRTGGPERGGPGAVRGGGGLGGRGVRTASGHAVRPPADERGAPERGAAADRPRRGEGAGAVVAGPAGLRRV
ncbi:LOW QUALITY PROTEIN: conserved hypothetical protein, partial [Streptomyces viridosporus ATCC 14672]